MGLHVDTASRLPIYQQLVQQIREAIARGELRPEAALPSAWSQALARTRPENTLLTRAFSGRAGRSIATEYVQAAAGPDAPKPAPYPVQRGLTAPMRKEAARRDNLNCMQAWAGQSAALALAWPAAELVQHLWTEAESLLNGSPHTAQGAP